MNLMIEKITQMQIATNYVERPISAYQRRFVSLQGSPWIYFFRAPQLCQMRKVCATLKALEPFSAIFKMKVLDFSNDNLMII